MKPKDVLDYVTGMDIIRQALAQEEAMYEARGLSPDSLPLDAGLTGAAEVYAARAKNVGLYAGTMACRLTGAHALYRGAKWLLS